MKGGIPIFRKLLIFIVILIFAFWIVAETIDDQTNKFAAQRVAEIRAGYKVIEQGDPGYIILYDPLIIADKYLIPKGTKIFFRDYEVQKPTKYVCERCNGYTDDLSMFKMHNCISTVTGEYELADYGDLSATDKWENRNE